MRNILKIRKYIEEGCTDSKNLGLELEHFVCDKNYNIIPYAELAECLEELCDILGAKKYVEDGDILGIIAEQYTMSLEPGRQLEISISPQNDVQRIVAIYDEFREIMDAILEKRGYALLEKGVHPLVENGTLDPANIDLIPKKRYDMMNQRFEHTGKLGKYMMRGTAATQVSIDYKDMEDAMKKMRVFERLSPILSLMTENKSNIGLGKIWDKHLIRNQIWNDVDGSRCGYLAMADRGQDLFTNYANYIMTAPCILMQKGESVIDTQLMTGQEYYSDNELNDIGEIEHLLSMFFPTVRLKRYIEIRMADSMPITKAVGYAVMIRCIAYNAVLLDELDAMLEDITTVEGILQAEEAIAQYGYKAQVYGRPVLEWIDYLLNRCMGVAEEAEVVYLSELISLPLINYQYANLIIGQEEAHVASAKWVKDYLMSSTAKYHERVVRTLYMPKLFTDKDMNVFNEIIDELYGIFDKVIEKFKTDEEYRGLFGFSEELNELILMDTPYTCNVPMSRIDIFYDEESGAFKFCEFNTDGSSAMNEDRELNIALTGTKAYKEFNESYEMYTCELFESWVREVLNIYRESHVEEAVPNVAIVDFMEGATLNEFIIYQETFEQMGIPAEICDIRELTWDGTYCYTKNGMKVDVIYRRAVTSDIEARFHEVGDFIEAVKSNTVCLIGGFKTQIAHNKVLYKILHMDETMEFLTLREQQYVKAHVPLTVSLSSEQLEKNPELKTAVYESKNSWIIKPEDSYGSKGVHAGVECESDEEWAGLVDQCIDQTYILQEFVEPYQIENIEPLDDERRWVKTSNLTGMFVYNGKFQGIYSRISLDKVISTQYNEMSVPTVIVQRNSYKG